MEVALSIGLRGGVGTKKSNRGSNLTKGARAKAKVSSSGFSGYSFLDPRDKNIKTVQDATRRGRSQRVSSKLEVDTDPFLQGTRSQTKLSKAMGPCIPTNISSNSSLYTDPFLPGVVPSNQDAGHENKSVEDETDMSIEEPIEKSVNTKKRASRSSAGPRKKRKTGDVGRKRKGLTDLKEGGSQSKRKLELVNELKALAEREGLSFLQLVELVSTHQGLDKPQNKKRFKSYSKCLKLKDSLLISYTDWTRLKNEFPDLHCSTDIKKYAKEVNTKMTQELGITKILDGEGYALSVSCLISKLLPELIEEVMDPDEPIQLKFTFDQRCYSGRREVYGGLAQLKDQKTHEVKNNYPVFIYLGKRTGLPWKSFSMFGMNWRIWNTGDLSIMVLNIKLIFLLEQT